MSDVLQRELGAHRVHAHQVIDAFFAPASRRDPPAPPPSGPELPVLPSSTADIAAAIASSLPPPMGLSGPPPEIDLAELSARAASPSDAGVPLLDDGPDPTPSVALSRPRSPRRRRFLSIGVVSVLFLAGAFAVGFAARRRGLVLADAPPLTMPPTARADAGDARETRLELRIAASPASAQIIVDENVVGTSSWSGLFERGSEHAIQVVAVGHTPKKSRITLDAPLLVTIELDPAPAATTASIVPAGRAVARASEPLLRVPPPAPPPVPSVSAPEPPPDPFAGGQAPRRPIDPKSPYD